MMDFVCVLMIAMCLCGAAFAAPLVTAYDKDGMVTVNGKRTLIIGTYNTGPVDRPYADLAEAGFNLVHAGSDKAVLDKIKDAGLMAWVTAGTLDLAQRETSAAALVNAVNAVKDHPAVAFLETTDEPAWTWSKAEPRVPAKALVEAFPLIKQADPNHLLYTNHAPTNLVSTLQQYNAGTDIVACDIYPVNPGGLRSMYALFPDGLQGDLNNEHISQVGEYTDKMRKVAGPDRPVFMVLQAFAWEALEDQQGINERRDEKIKYPTYRESRFMAYNALIHGANGIVYWGSQSLPKGSEAWLDIKRVVREIANLAAPLAQPASDVKPTIEYHEVGHSVDDGVQILAKEDGKKLYLFTCNADKNPCKATLAGLDAWKLCNVIDENRNLLVEKGSITDTWRRFEVHVYEFSK